MGIFENVLKKSVGLPDSEFLLKGKVSDKPIRDRLRLNRHQYSAAKAAASSWFKKKKYPRVIVEKKGGSEFLNFYALPGNRRMVFYDYARSVATQVPFTKCLPSWEAAVIEAYSPRFFSRALSNSGKQPVDLPVVSMTAASTVINAKPKESNDSLEIEALVRRLEPAMQELIAKVLESLADWESLDETSRQLLGCVVWAIMTTAGDLGGDEFLAYEPILAPYYNFVLGRARGTGDEGAGKAIAACARAQGDQPKTAAALYEELSDIARRGQKSPLDPELAEHALQTANLISSALAESIDDEELDALARGILNVLLFDLSNMRAFDLLNDGARRGSRARRCRSACEGLDELAVRGRCEAVPRRCGGRRG